jgi:hypothetical protein
MASRRRFRPRLTRVTTHSGTVERRKSGHVDRPSNRVGEPENSPRRECEGRPSGQPESSGVDTQEKLSRGVCQAPVPQTDTGGRGEQPQVIE